MAQACRNIASPCVLGNMSVFGTRFDEDYDNLHADVRVYEQIYLWRPRTARQLPATITDYYGTLRNARAHGGPFDYRSILTDDLGWVIERAAPEGDAQLTEGHAVPAAAEGAH